MPVNLSRNNNNNNNNSAAEHQGSKYGVVSQAGDTRGGEGNKGGGGGGGGGAARALVKTEGQASMGVSCSVGAYREEPREEMRMAYEQNHYDLSRAGYLKDEQRGTPGSTYEDAGDGEVRPGRGEPETTGARDYGSPRLREPETTGALVYVSPGLREPGTT